MVVSVVFATLSCHTGLQQRDSKLVGIHLCFHANGHGELNVNMTKHCVGEHRDAQLRTKVNNNKQQRVFDDASHR